MKTTMTLQTILSLLIIGILAGVLSGLVGVGGGVIMVPLMVLFFGMSQHQAQGTSLAVLAVPVTAVAVYNYYQEGHINVKFALILGSKVAINLDQKMLKKIFGVVLLIIAGKMLLDK